MYFLFRDVTRKSTLKVNTHTLKAGQAKTQLIAHDKEVLDVRFSNSVDCFASVGSDGSLRMFDLRSLDHSTILFETTDTHATSVGSNTSPTADYAAKPLLKLDWHHLDPCYIATFASESSKIFIIDIRSPGKTVNIFNIPTGAAVTDLHWCPHSPNTMVLSGLDDLIYVWNDVTHSAQEEPQLFFDASIVSNLVINANEHSATIPTALPCVNALAWHPNASHYLAFGYGSSVQILSI